MHTPRIAYVITDLQTGGVPLHLLRLAEKVRERRLDPHVVSLASGGDVAKALAERNIPVHHCAARGCWDAGVIVRLARILRRLRPDLVHSLLFHANVASRLAAVFSGRSRRRLICEIQTVEIERKWHLTVDNVIHRLGSHVVGNSVAVAEHLRCHAHVAPSRLCCVPGGVDVSAFDAAEPLSRGAMGVAGAGPAIVFVGRLDPVKGIDELLEAFAHVAECHDATLWIVGEGAYRAHLQQVIAQSALGHRVVMAGSRDDVPRVLKAASLFVLPSYTEGFPNALLEAMAAGLPVVATDVSGSRDLVQHEGTGLLVPPRNAHALHGAVVRLLVDRALSQRLGAAAREHVRQAYSFGRCVDRYLALYRHVLSECQLLAL